MLLSIMHWVEAISAWPFENPHLWVLLWPAPSLCAWASGFRSKRLFWFNFFVGWFPPFWIMAWMLILVPQLLDGESEPMKRDFARISN